MSKDKIWLLVGVAMILSLVCACAVGGYLLVGLVFEGLSRGARTVKAENTPAATLGNTRATPFSTATLLPTSMPTLDSDKHTTAEQVCVEYKADSLPQDASPSWTAVISGHVKAEVKNGFLYLDTTDRLETLGYFKQEWNAHNALGSLVEAKVKLDNYTGGPNQGGAAIALEDDISADVLLINLEGIHLYSTGLAYDMDTMHDYHTYRIAATGHDIKVYVDGRLAIDGTGTFGRNFWRTEHIVYFGDGSGGASSESSWQSVRYCYGAR